MDSSNAPALRLMSTLKASPTGALDCEIDVIGIPGIGTIPIDQWNLGTMLKDCVRNVRGIAQVNIFALECYIPSDGIFSWQMILDQGHELLDLLLQAGSNHQGTNRRTIFVCHSLGGVVLKQALTTAYKNIQKFENTVRKILGIVFLGTPHSAASDLETWKSCVRVLRVNSRHFSKRTQGLRHDRDEIFKLSNLAVQFAHIASDVPILSVYDGQETRIGREKVFKTKSCKLVDKSLASISCSTEELMEAPFAHNDLCNFEHAASISYPVFRFVEQLLRDAKGKANQPREPRKTELADEAETNKSVDAFGTGTAGMLKGTDTQRKFINPESKTAIQVLRNVTEINIPPRKSFPTAQKIRLPCFMVARQTPNRDFFRRDEELKILDRHLLPSVPTQSNMSRTFAICGMGGIGKTDLAVEFVYSRKQHYDAVFWIDSAGDSQLASEFGRIAAELGLEEPTDAQDLITSRESAKAWMAGRTPVNRSSWLLVFDHADKLELLSDYWPKQGNGSVLVTSRDPLAKSNLSFDIAGLDLEPFSVLEGAEFVRRLTNCDNSKEERDASEAMAYQLGGLPLAIFQMAGVIRRKELTIAEFITMYEGDAEYAKLRHVSNNAQRMRYGNTLATTWNLDDLGAHSLSFLKVISMLSSDRIQESMFLEADADLSADFKFLQSAKGFQDAKEDLLRSSIIKRSREHKELRINRMISQEVRTRMEPNDRYTVFCTVVTILCTVWPFNLLEKRHATARWRRCEEIFPHVEQVQKLYEENAEAWASEAVDIKLVKMLQDGGAYLHERGFSFQGKPYLERSLYLCEKLASSPESEALLSEIYYTLGAVANETNNGPDCLKYNVILLEMRKNIAKKSGKEDVPLAAAHSQIGIAYMMMGKYALATDHFKESIAMFQRLENFMVDMLAFPMANLGLAYWIQGQLEYSERTFIQALTERELQFGKMDKVSYKTGRILHGLGNVKASMSDACAESDPGRSSKLMQESWQLHNSALQQLESTLGNHHHRVADLCHKIAEHYIRCGEHESAQGYLDRALSIWGSKEWYENQVARSTFLKGNHLISLGGKDAEEGRRCIMKAETLRRKILPDEEPREFAAADYDELVVFWSR